MPEETTPYATDPTCEAATYTYHQTRAHMHKKHVQTSTHHVIKLTADARPEETTPGATAPTYAVANSNTHTRPNKHASFKQNLQLMPEETTPGATAPTCAAAAEPRPAVLGAAMRDCLCVESRRKR